MKENTKGKETVCKIHHPSLFLRPPSTRDRLSGPSLPCGLCTPWPEALSRLAELFHKTLANADIYIKRDIK